MTTLFRHILVPTDGSRLSARAEATAAAMARRLKARITAVHVVDLSAPQTAAEIQAVGLDPLSAQRAAETAHRRGRAALAKAKERARRARVPCDVALVTSNEPSEAILDVARENGCDLIVMATSGRVGLERLMFGSVATDVILRSRLPVLVCR